MDLKWQVAMISMRLKKFYKKTGRKLQFDAKEPVGFDKTKVECFNCHKTGHFARECRSKGNQDIRRRDAGKHLDIKQKTMGGDLENRRNIKLGHSGSNTETKLNEWSFDSHSSENKKCSLWIESFAKVEGMHAVPPPMTGNYMPPKSDFGIDESQFTYGPKQNSLNSVPEPVVIEPKVVSQPKVWSDAPIIEEYESDSDDEYVIKSSKEQETPSFAFVNTVKHVKTPRETVKEQNTCNQSPKVDKRDWNGLMSKKIGLGYGFTRKACFVCDSFGHLIRDCYFHEKRMAKQVELNKKKSKGTGQGENRLVWNNVQRLNHQNKFVPTAILIRTGRFPINTARHNFNSQAVSTSAARKANVVRPIVNDIYIDNESTICIVKNPVFHSKTKHIEIRHHFIRDAYEKKLIQVLKIHTNDNVADLLTKAFDVSRGDRDAKCKIAVSSPLAALVSCPKHNMVTCLEKTEWNAQFHEIVDFLTRSSIYYSLTVSPTVSTSLIEQFWNTATSKTVNDVSYIKAKVAGKTVSIFEASIRRDLLFNDVDGIDCLTNQEIYENLQLMGYEGDLTILTFQKALFSPQWRYLIHTLIHYLSSKSTSWDQFPTNVASALICLATDRKFNFSKMIFKGHVIPLFPNMLAQAVVDEGEGSEQPTEPQPTPSPTQPSTGDQPPMTESSYRPDTTQDTKVNLEGTSGSQGDHVQIPHDSPLSGGHTSDRAEGGLNLEELSVLFTNLSNRVLALETSKGAQAAEILKLKTRIKKLKKKCQPVISYHRAWLRSVSRLSMKKKLGKKESVSKQGRKNAKSGPKLDDSAFDDLDADLAHGMDDMETKEAVNEGRQSNETEKLNLDDDTKVITEDKGSGEKGGSTVSTATPEVSTARPEVSTARPKIGIADPKTPPTTTTIFDDEEMTLADTLVKMKDNKAKCVVFKYTKELVRPARSVLTLKPLPSIDPKDKGKGVLEEPEPAKKMTRSDFDAVQVARDAKVARQIDADHELAVRLTHEEQEKYTVDDRAKLLAEFIERRKKQLAEERAAAIRNKPLTRTQLRSLMMTYLKHTCRFKHSQLNKRTLEEIQAIYIKERERAANFVPIGYEEDERLIQKMNKKAVGVHVEKVLEEPDSTKVEVKQEAVEQGTRKTPGKVLKMKARKKRKGGPRMKRQSKRKKTDSDLKEEEHLKTFLKIVPDEEGIIDFESASTTGSLDLMEVLDGLKPFLRWTMFEANAEDELWQNQEGWNLKSWDFYENCGVHTLTLEDGTEIHMLAERRYPLTKETLERMMSLKLIAESASDSAYDLLRFIQKQIDEAGSHDGGENDL
ncbi:ribonuclease H-like domain, gag-pre-integrase domain protein [Tanacetum coccineum]